MVVAPNMLVHRRRRMHPLNGVNGSTSSLDHSILADQSLRCSKVGLDLSVADKLGHTTTLDSIRA